MKKQRARAAANRIHAGLPKGLAAEIPITLILLIILELLKRCPMRARPEIVRKRAIDGLAGKRDEIGLVVRKVNKVARKVGCVMSIDKARTIAGTVLQAAAESDLTELAAVIGECREYPDMETGE